MSKRVFLRLSTPDGTLATLVLIGWMDDNEDISAVLSRAPLDSKGFLPDGLPVNVPRSVLVEEQYSPAPTSDASGSHPQVGQSILGKRKRLSDNYAGVDDLDPLSSSTAGAMPWTGESLSSSDPYVGHGWTYPAPSNPFVNFSPAQDARAGTESTSSYSFQQIAKKPRLDSGPARPSNPSHEVRFQSEGRLQPVAFDDQRGYQSFIENVNAMPVAQASDQALVNVPSSNIEPALESPRVRTATDKIKACQQHYQEQVAQGLAPPTGLKRKRRETTTDAASANDDEAHDQETEQPAKKVRRRAKIPLHKSTCPKGEELAKILKRGPYFVEGQPSGGAKKLAREHGLEDWQSNSIDVSCSNWLKKNFSPEECTKFRLREMAAKKKKTTAAGSEEPQSLAEMTATSDGAVDAATHQHWGNHPSMVAQTGVPFTMDQPQEGESAGVRWSSDDLPSEQDTQNLVLNSDIFDESAINDHHGFGVTNSQGVPANQAARASESQSSPNESSQFEVMWDTFQCSGLPEVPHDFVSSPEDPLVCGFCGSEVSLYGVDPFPGADWSSYVPPGDVTVAQNGEQPPWEPRESTSEVDRLALLSDEELLGLSDPALNTTAGVTIYNV